MSPAIAYPAIASPRMTARAAPPANAYCVDLKWSLTLRVAAVATVCFLIAGAFAFYSICREIERTNETVAELVAKQLQLQLVRIEANLEAPAQFPDWEPVIGYVQGAGQCVHFARTDGNERSSCIGVNRNSGPPPAWFSYLTGWTGVTPATVTRAVTHREKTYGVLRVTIEPAAVLAAIWKDISGLLGLTALLVAATCLLQYAAISRALRPTRDILLALDRLAQGDLSCRLPNFQLTELQRISEVFNTLAASLEQTTRERSALAARLVNGHEQERQHLARELHDELAQTLSAMSARAASIKVTAEKECPGVASEAQDLSHIARGVMRSLRMTLHTLRPPEIDDFGLAATLGALVRDHENRAGGKLRIELDVGADLRGLPPTTAAHLYRIVQEGLTNIGKHAKASRARVVLSFHPTASGQRWLKLTIEDDGCGALGNGIAEGGGGLGLIGMRERAIALGGRLDVVQLDRSFKLQAVIPLHAPEAMP